MPTRTPPAPRRNGGEWAEEWPTGARVQLGAQTRTANGSLHRYTQSLPREYARCLGKLRCGHVGLRPAAVWLLTVVIDLCRAGAAPKTQAAAVREAGLTRSTGKRAFAELEAGGFVVRDGVEVRIELPQPEEVIALLEARCGQCAGSGAQPAAVRVASERQRGPGQRSTTQGAGAAEVGEIGGAGLELPEWAEGVWYDNLVRRVGRGRAEQACMWTEHRRVGGAEIHNPKGYAATVAEVYAGRRPGRLGVRQVSGRELQRLHQAELREQTQAKEKEAWREELAAGAAQLLALGILREEGA